MSLTVNDLIKHLNILKDEGFGDHPLIYASDDEGNEFHKVNTLASPIRVENLDTYFLAVMDEEDPIMCNAICIN